MAARRRAAAACALLACFGQIPRCRAWSPKGHERINRIAQALLHGKHRDQVRALLHGDVVDFAGWEKAMSGKYPATEALHWHRQDPEWSCGRYREAGSNATQPESAGLLHIGDKAGHIQCDNKAADEGSLFCALAFFFYHFAHEKLLEEAYPIPAEPINAPLKMKAIKDVPKLERTPAHYLRWLTVLIGDLHQPMHWLRDHDYGRTMKVSFRGKQYTLLDFWEDFLPRQLPPVPSKKSMDEQYKTRSPGWMHTAPPELFRNWAKEMAMTLCHSVYEAMALSQKDGSRELQNPFMLSEEIYERWRGMAHDFTVLGGQRLAFVLNDILEHRRHKHAHKDGRGRHHHRLKSWPKNFAANAFLAVVVVPLLLGAFKWHDSCGASDLAAFFKGSAGKSF